MKLVAIYNVWNDWDLLSYSIRNIRPLVDGIIIVGSTYSNFKDFSPIPEEFKTDELYVHEPRFNIPMHSETDKRNFGLHIAKINGYTHFLTIDADEFYEPEHFLREKKRFHVEPDLKGLVCLCQTYFKSPTLTIGLDSTLVPFIHELTPTIQHEFNRTYPFAWSGNQIRIDPTRSLNISSGVKMCDLKMHHMSWIRKDYEKKIRNSTARSNLERSTIRQDLASAKDGEFCNFYGKRLTTVPNRFNLPLDGELLFKDILPVEATNKEA